VPIASRFTLDNNTFTLKTTFDDAGRYSHRVTAYVTYQLWGFPLPEEDYDDFNTQVTETIPIPEYPTIALPVLTILGIIYMMSRKRRT
jgi:hypothetical protein